MRVIERFLGFWYDFVVGDDWSIAAGAAVGLGLTWVLVQLGLNPWWLMPLVVTVVLAISLRRGVSQAKQKGK
jgi:hypothetical protein